MRIILYYKQIGDKIVDNLENNLKIVDKSFVVEAFHKENFQISDEKAELLLHFYELLIQKNRVMNLTGITEFTQVVYKHFLDSVYGWKVMNSINGDGLAEGVNSGDLTDRVNGDGLTDRAGDDCLTSISVIDVGTGAGFPGIPLKICYPGLNMTLMDSLNKRVGFLNEVIEELALTDIRTVHSRAEDLGRNSEYREQFDVAVSRAVADLAVLSEYCLPFVKTGGRFISYKGGNVEEELNRSKKAIEMLGGRVADVKYFSYDVKTACRDVKKKNVQQDDIRPKDAYDKNVPENGEETCRRSLVVIEKIKETAKKYPRKAGTPGKMPLGRKMI